MKRTYKIIESDKKVVFEQLVNEALEAGWDLQGGANYVVILDKLYYYQSIVITVQ